MKWCKVIFLFQVVFHLSFNITAQKVMQDVSYLADATPEQKMDIYLPAIKNFRAILFLHEGSLLGGDKKDKPLEEIAKKFQGDGLCFVSANYRLGPQNKWPSQPDDVCSAFRWLKNNLTALQGDTSMIFIMGHSSGAFLAALVATDPKYMSAKGFSLKSIAGFIPVGTQLRPTLPAVPGDKLPQWFKKDNYLKIFGTRTVFDDANPMAHINADIPKGLVIIAESEQFQPPLLEQAMEFIETGKRIGLNLRYKVIPGRTHMSTISKMTEDDDSAYNLVKNFILE